MIPSPPYKLSFDEFECENSIIDSKNRKVFVCAFEHFSDVFEEDKFLENVVMTLNNPYEK